MTFNETYWKQASDEEKFFLAEYDPSKFPIICNTVDLIVHTNDHVLLIKRKNYPYKGHWALPGGFIDQKETTSVAALRELREEAGLLLTERDLTFVGVADDPARDPRARTISFVYAAAIPQIEDLYAGDDAVEAVWFPWGRAATKPNMLAFDHETILTRYLQQIGRARL